MLTPESARRIEAALDAIGGPYPRKREQQVLESRLSDFAQAVLRAVGKNPRETEGPAIQALFEPGLSRGARQFIAVCLMRLMAAQYQPFEETTFRQSAVALFDAAFADTLYKTLNVTHRQSYERLSELEQAVSDVDRTIGDLVSEQYSVASARELQQRLMRLVKRPPASVLVTPFLPSGLLSARQTELFRAVSALDEAEPTAFLSAYDRAVEEITSYRSESIAFGTKYSRALLGGIADQLQAAVEAYFEGSPLSQRAALQIGLSEKRYPLGEPGTPFPLQFVVSNESDGHASNVSVVIEEAEGLAVEDPVVGLGALGRGAATVPVRVRVIDERLDPRVLVTVHWANTDRTAQSVEAVLELPAQRRDVPWEELRTKQPYTLQPVTREEDLVGRSETQGRLLSTSVAEPPMGNAIISGQRRVGKTSIANAALSRVRAQPTPFVGASLLAGPSGGRDLNETVRKFGRAICRALRAGLVERARTDAERQRALGRAQSIALPSFDEGLSPLVEYLEDVRTEIPDVRLLLVIDEFDELPTHVFEASPVARAFFNTFREIAGDPLVSLILVGGENLAFALKEHADTQNLFRPFPVDYFDRSRHWGDFVELVRAPVSAWLEISDEAVAHLYNETAGHPYFTKMICERAFDAAVKARDAYLSVTEIDRARLEVAKDANASSFAHFWQDAIFESSEEMKKARDVQRRLVLHGLAHCLRKASPPSAEAVDEEIRFSAVDLPTSDVLGEFVQRDVLVDDKGMYRCHVALFERWLLEHGPEQIVVTPEDVRRLRRPSGAVSTAERTAAAQPGSGATATGRSGADEPEIEEIRYPSPEEIARLTDRWGTYRGQAITTDLVRRFLGQFGEAQQQRIALRILQRLRFYNARAVREKLAQAGDIVKGGSHVQLPPGVTKRRDIAVGYLDGPGKSGAQWARNFAQQHGIHATNVLEQAALGGATLANPDVRVLVFLDDFIGTGGSAVQNFTHLNQRARAALTRHALRVEFLAAAGFQPGIDALEERLSELDLPVRVHVLDVLGDEDRCFHEKSRVFPDREEREYARRVISEIGRNLSRSPMGYGDTEAVVVFSDSCPNNSLPVLWQETDEWKPLFPRF